MTEPTLYTLGHSTRTIEDFLELLERYDINAIADVRSVPYSRFNPQFNREELHEAVTRTGRHYVFLGDELGARRKEPECYINGVAHYKLIHQSPLFQQGITRVKRGIEKMRVSLMCAEKDPVVCHRTVLISRYLKHEMALKHIISQEECITQHDLERRLLKCVKLPEQDLISTREELIEEAYNLRSLQMQYEVDPLE